MPAFLAILALVLAAAALVSAQKRHERLRRRFKQLESTLAWTDARADRSERRLYELLIQQSLASPPRLPLTLTSQFGEDSFLWELLRGQREGLYIEVGAFDGITLSATYALEAIGWTGLLVEPLPDRFAQCKANRPHSTVIRAAVGKRGSAGTLTINHLIGEENNLNDLASFASTDGSAGREQANYIVKTGAQVATVEAPLTTLAQLLAQHFPGRRVDFAVIDVEGFEAQVLDGLELDAPPPRLPPRILIIEDLVAGGDQPVIDLLHRAGYQCVASLGHNRIWIHQSEPDLIHRGRVLAQGGAVRGGL